KSGLSVRLSDKLSVGIAAGWFLEKIAEYRGSAFHADAGILLEPKENITLGASATNIGSSFRLGGAGRIVSRDISLPATYRAGGSYRYGKYLGALDLVIIDGDFHPHLGFEADLHESFSARAGYMALYDSKNITAGLSFSHRNLIIDYAFVPYGNNLGTAHMFNLTVSL
ncbi:MAG: hypothetical protein V3T31_02005, partial [candidate division Zixibacteria bacterium]